MKHVDVKSSTCTDFYVENNEKCPKFEVDDLVIIFNIKTFSQKHMLKISINNFLRFKKLKIQCR